MENIALAGDIQKGLSLTGAETATRIGDNRLRIEALINQVEQTNAPSVGVAMFLQTKQVAIGRGRVDTREDWLAGLENLVMGSNPDTS